MASSCCMRHLPPNPQARSIAAASKSTTRLMATTSTPSRRRTRESQACRGRAPEAPSGRHLARRTPTRSRSCRRSTRRRADRRSPPPASGIGQHVPPADDPRREPCSARRTRSRSPAHVRPHQSRSPRPDGVSARPARSLSSHRLPTTAQPSRTAKKRISSVPRQKPEWQGRSGCRRRSATDQPTSPATACDTDHHPGHGADRRHASTMVEGTR